MHEVMQPYGHVSRKEYDQGRPERERPDFMLEGSTYILRYIQNRNPVHAYAADYVVCIQGIYDVRRGHHIDFAPVPLDSPIPARAIGHLAADLSGIIIKKNTIISAEKGYFTGPAELYPDLKELGAWRTPYDQFSESER